MPFENSRTGHAAVAYAELGMAVFAPAWGSKVPNKDMGGVPGRTSATATTNLDVLVAIYDEKPGNNVAVRLDRCAPPLVAVDCDSAISHPTAEERAKGITGKDGWDVLDDWLTENDVELTPTWTILTASGGMNRIYVLPEGETMPKTQTSAMLRVDLLGAGQPLTMPPSVIKGKGEHYRWMDGLSPDDVEPAVLPAALLDFWRQATAKRAESGTSVSNADDGNMLRITSRNRDLFSFGCSLRARGADDAEVREEVTKENAARYGTSALDVREVDGIIRSVLRYKPGDRRKKHPTQGEIALRMRGDNRIYGKFGTNVLDGGIYVHGRLPWTYGPEYRRWHDSDEQYLFTYAQEKFGATSRANVAGAFKIVCAENSFNPIADMLDSLPEWDGTPRAAFMLWALFGAKDTKYTRAVSSLWMRGAVRRGYEPGCKFDYTLVLRGNQGIKKSLTGRMLANGEEFFCETVTDITNPKTTAEQIGGKWIVELGELAGIKGRELESVKAALTAQKMTVRHAYAHFAVDQPRSCVFLATTNERAFLSDPTGNRRFLPVECGAEPRRNGWERATKKELREFIEQAWAEVVSRYKSAKAEARDEDEFLRLYPLMPDAELDVLLADAREDVSVEDSRIGVIGEWLDGQQSTVPPRVCARMVAEEALGLDSAFLERNKYVTVDVARILNDNYPEWIQLPKKCRCGKYGVTRVWEYSRVRKDN